MTIASAISAPSLPPDDGPAGVFDLQRLFDLPDPYPAFARMRADRPVARLEMFGFEFFAVTRYDDVATVLRDADTFSSQGNAQVAQYMGPTIVTLDGEEHARRRAALQRMFVHRAVARLAPAVAGLVHGLIDRFAGDGRVDLVPALTAPFPIQVIAGVLGIPPEDHARFLRWSLGIVGFTKDPDAAAAAAAALREYLLPIVVRRRVEPRDDVVSALLAPAADGASLTDDEVVDSLRLLIPAGAETTSRLTATVLFALAAAPERYARVQADRALVRWAIEEALRWETPIPFVARRTTRAVVLRDVAVPARRTVLAVIGSGNRDEERYDRPDEFDLDRRADDHLSFGLGRHFCLGYHLARLEAEVAVTAVLDRLRDLRFDARAPAPAICGLAFRSPPALPVRFDA